MVAGGTNQWLLLSSCAVAVRPGQGWVDFKVYARSQNNRENGKSKTAQYGKERRQEGKERTKGVLEEKKVG